MNIWHWLALAALFFAVQLALGASLGDSAILAACAAGVLAVVNARVLLRQLRNWR